MFVPHAPITFTLRPDGDRENRSGRAALHHSSRESNSPNVDEYAVIPDNDTNPSPLTSGIEPVTIICPGRDRRIRSAARLAPRPQPGQNSTHNEFNAR
ncbi:hypothetical protein J2W56_005462 [Nocardia kruczakiae]|uniref:Uncharacterized protein n=1 Tax=Nocardia kruczakiae TaxID=261477 RepID=A0ABU1XNY7_9NOCA|nr:hypothetical protein [Nocardia kruczakiae]MDR7171702.1 hypothetical protein [Nocardia kruczakiae]